MKALSAFFALFAKFGCILLAAFDLFLQSTPKNYNLRPEKQKKKILLYNIQCINGDVFNRRADKIIFNQS